MATLLLVVVFGYCFAYFASQNMQQVTVNLSKTSHIDLPLHIVILSVFLLGTLASWLLQAIETISFLIKMYGKEKLSKKSQLFLPKINPSV